MVRPIWPAMKSCWKPRPNAAWRACGSIRGENRRSHWAISRSIKRYGYPGFAAQPAEPRLFIITNSRMPWHCRPANNGKRANRGSADSIILCRKSLPRPECSRMSWRAARKKNSANSSASSIKHPVIYSSKAPRWPAAPSATQGRTSATRQHPAGAKRTRTDAVGDQRFGERRGFGPTGLSTVHAGLTARRSPPRRAPRGALHDRARRLDHRRDSPHPDDS